MNRTTLNKWIEKYDRKDLMNTRITVETTDEIGRIKALQKEVEQLKTLLLNKDLDKLVLDAYLEVAYIRTVKGFCYLALITDLYSRKIVGFDVSDSLELLGVCGPSKRPWQTPSLRADLYITPTEAYTIAANNM